MEKNVKKMWIRTASTLLLTVFFSLNLLAQTTSIIDVKGTVEDDFGPVIGANVLIKGTMQGVVTNTEGEFMIKAPQDATLVISYIGYKTIEVQASSSPRSIKMEEDLEMLDEIIVIGYATGSKRTVSGTIDRVSKKYMNVGVVNSPLDALKGKVAGVIFRKWEVTQLLLLPFVCVEQRLSPEATIP